MLYWVGTSCRSLLHLNFPNLTVGRPKNQELPPPNAFGWLTDFSPLLIRVAGNEGGFRCPVPQETEDSSHRRGRPRKTELAASKPNDSPHLAHPGISISKPFICSSIPSTLVTKEEIFHKAPGFDLYLQLPTPPLRNPRFRGHKRPIFVSLNDEPLPDLSLSDEIFCGSTSSVTHRHECRSGSLKCRHGRGAPG